MPYKEFKNYQLIYKTITKAIFLVALVFGLNSNLYAQNQTTGKLQITAIANWVGGLNNPNEVLYIVTDQDTYINPAECSKSTRYLLNDASDISKSMILAAFASGYDVTFIISGNSCLLDFPAIVNVAIFK